MIAAIAVATAALGAAQPAVAKKQKQAELRRVLYADTFDVLERIDMGQKLEQAGYPDMSSAVRPMALSPDERFVYFQVRSSTASSSTTSSETA